LGSISAYQHDLVEELMIDIFEKSDTPSEGVSVFSTVGLYNYYGGTLSGNNKELNPEIMFVSSSELNYSPGILSTLAFMIIRGELDVEPGMIYENLTSEDYPDSDMKHALLAYPYSWEMGYVELPKTVVPWLQVVPISDAELKCLQKSGYDKLRQLFEDNDIEEFNLYRKSVL
jgi:hypothetical protein